MAMIELQADPLIEWDDTKTKMSEQTEDAQAWIADNVMNVSAVTVNETVFSVVHSTNWDRPLTQEYTNNGFKLTVNRVYKTVESSVIDVDLTTNVLTTV